MAQIKYLSQSKEYKLFLSPLEYTLILSLLKTSAVFETEEEQLFRHDLRDDFEHPEKF
jgi:hypothetical protein